MAVMEVLHLHPIPFSEDFNSCNDGDETGEKSTKLIRVCTCVYLSAKSGEGLVIFGHGRRGAMTACGLRTEDLVFFMERGELRGEVRGVGSEEYFTVDVLLPFRQLMNYYWLK